MHAMCCSFELTGLDFDVHMSIFVSPIVFPLAFSINGKLKSRAKSNWHNLFVNDVTRTSQIVNPAARHFLFNSPLSKHRKYNPEMPTSGDLKSGDCLFLLPPRNFNHPPPRKIDPAPNGNDLGHYMTSYMMYLLSKFES